MPAKNTRIRSLLGTASAALLLSSTCLLPMDAEATGRPDDLLSGEKLSTYPAAVARSIPDIDVPRFVCMTPDGEVIYSRNATDKCKIASVTKVMTFLIASEYPMDLKLTVSEHAATIPGSGAGLEAGDEATLYDLCQGLMLPSGNDAAYAIAEGLGQKMLAAEGNPTSSWEPAVKRFVDEMNKKAGSLQMTSSLFANPCGLDDEGFEGEHISSAEDVAKMTYAAMKVPVIAEICGKKSAGMLLTRKGKPTVIELLNTNHLLEWRNDTRGTKTGFTDAAGACLAGSVELDGELYYTALLGGGTYDQTLGQTSLLWDWMDKSVSNVEMLFAGLDKSADGKGYIVGQVAVPDQQDSLVDIRVDDDGKRKKFSWENTDTVKLELVPMRERGVIKTGDVMGHLIVDDGTGEPEQMDVIADGDAAANNLVDSLACRMIHVGTEYGASAPGYASDAPAKIDPEISGA